jgi:hypothetical protein
MKKLLLIALVAGGLMFTAHRVLMLAYRSELDSSSLWHIHMPIRTLTDSMDQPFTRDHHFTGTTDVAFLSRGILMFTMFIIDNELNAASTKSLSWLDIHVEPA